MQQIRNKAKTKRMILQNKLWNHSLCKILNYILVRERGLEPPRPEGHQPLKLTRLPIPPFAHKGDLH